MDIKRLEYVDVRKIWENEARDFTRWLAENIEFLNEKLGFTLSVQETERQIGNFNVDIFCEDEQGNSVIIENQLEKTDHSHLGQILTYAVGAAASTVIWISTSPRPEHEAVIQWLNEVTPVDMKWYLFKLDAVKIGSSAVAPLFTQVVGPSYEIKVKGKEKKELAERHEKRLAFWELLLSRLEGNTLLFSNTSPTKDNWITVGTGVGGVYYQIKIRMDSAAIQLIIERDRSGAKNKEIFDFLFANKENIEKAFGDKIVWKRMDEQISSRIYYPIEQCQLQDQTTWEEGCMIIVQKMIAWDKAFRPYIAQIKKTLL